MGSTESGALAAGWDFPATVVNRIRDKQRSDFIGVMRAKFLFELESSFRRKSSSPDKSKMRGLAIKFPLESDREILLSTRDKC
jgi:hypothetical protein